MFYFATESGDHVIKILICDWSVFNVVVVFVRWSCKFWLFFWLLKSFNLFSLFNMSWTDSEIESLIIFIRPCWFLERVSWALQWDRRSRLRVLSESYVRNIQDIYMQHNIACIFKTVKRIPASYFGYHINIITTLYYLNYTSTVTPSLLTQSWNFLTEIETNAVSKQINNNGVSNTND